MSYEYGGTLFDNVNQAAYAALEDFLYAQGWNSRGDVAEMNAQSCLEDLLSNAWEVPGVTDLKAILWILQKIIDDAKSKAEKEA